MELEIRPFLADDQPAVAAFNARLRARGVHYQFPGSPTPEWLPRIEGRRLYQEHFLAVDPDGEVRGGYILKHQDFLVNGRVHSLTDYQLPLSEGITDARFNFVGVRLLANALSRRRPLFALGMGGFDDQLVRMLLAMRWRAAAVPFFFWVAQPYRFLRNITHLRHRRPLRLACDLAAITGLGWLGVKAAQNLRAIRRPRDPDVAWSEPACFEEWADTIWDQARSAYQLIAVRNREVMEILYPPDTSPEESAPGPAAGGPNPRSAAGTVWRRPRRFIRLLVTRRGRAIGWAVLLATPMVGHKHFGNMKVGTLVDCLSVPGEEPAVVIAAWETLRRRSVDLMVSNQSHAAWQAALRRCGWLSGPSNFLFAAAPELCRTLEPWEGGVERFHLNRGDGDGPINL